MTRVPRHLDHPRRLSLELCAAIALGMILAQLLVGQIAFLSERDRMVEAAGEHLSALIATMGPEREPEALREYLQRVRGLGVTALRLAEGDPFAVEQDGELVVRDQGIEMRLSLAAVDGAMFRFGLWMLISGAISLLAGCGAVWLYVTQSGTIQAAERAAEYRQSLEWQDRALREAEQRAASLDRAKTELMANVSHELRTPLTAILGFSEEMIERGFGSGAGAGELDDIRTIQRNADYLYRLVSSLLDYSDLETGRLWIDWGPCSPTEVMRDVEASSAAEASAKGLRLRAEIDDDLPAEITTDGARIRQIISLLVDNAIKFTDDGAISLGGSVLTEGYAQPHVAFDVIDTGIGMTSEQLARLFDSFAQGDGSRARPYGGLGLGLALAQRLARELSGEITVVSTPAEGSAFRLTLPVTPPQSEGDTLTEMRAAELDGEPEADEPLAIRILVAEDGDDNRKLLQRILSGAGAEVTLVDDGQQAVDLAVEAWERDDPFDMILMDAQMPGFDGIRATRALRQQSYPGPIVALSADNREENRRECLAAGCDLFLAKPVEREELLTTTRAVVAKAESLRSGPIR